MPERLDTPRVEPAAVSQIRLWTGWYENGQKKFEQIYKYGKEEGIFTSWYENGKKKKEGTMKDGEEVGKWTWYNNDGSVKRVEEY